MNWKRSLIGCAASLLLVSSVFAQSPRNLGNTEVPGSVRCVSPDGLSFESCGGGGGGGGDGAINDGVSSSIKATVHDYTNSNPLAVTLKDTNGDPVSVGGGTQYNQGTVATDTDALTMAGCVRSDTPAVATGVIDGDRARCVIDSTGRLWVHVGVVDGTIAAIQSGAWNVGQSGTWNITNISGTISLPTGAATAALQDGIIKDGAGDTTQANVSSGNLHVNLQTALPAGTNNIGDVDVLTLPALPAGNNNIGDVDIASLPNEGTQTAANSISVTIASDIATGATTIPTSAQQGLVVRQPISCPNYVAISQTADTAVITATASQYIYVCSIVLVVSAAETVSIWEGTGTACGTGSTAILGSTTEANGMSFSATSGLSAISPVPFFRTASTNVDLCIRQSGANRVSGMISYIKAP